jgi:hypothetical protein
MHWFALGGLALLLTAGHAASLPYVTQPAFPGVTVDQPVAIVSPPGDARRIFVVEKPGRILIFDASSPPASATVFLDLRERVGDDSGEQGPAGAGLSSRLADQPPVLRLVHSPRTTLARFRSRGSPRTVRDFRGKSGSG